MKTVVITGAAGFLGRQFLEHHVAAGDTVYAVDDFSNGEPIAGYTIATGDAAWFLKTHLGYPQFRADLAYHFAAPVGGREKIEGDPLFNADSLRLDSEFFRWAVGHVDTAIYPSSSAVYGVTFQTGQGIPLKESMFDPREFNWPQPDEMYGFTKMAGEVLAFKAAQYGLNTLCIRPFSGYGGTQSLQYPVPSICLRALHGEDPLIVWGAGTQTRDFVHVRDLVEATLAILGRGIDGYQAFNIGSGTPTSFIQVAQMAANIMAYEPVVDVDGSKPQGVAARYADTTKLDLIYQPKITLKDGLTEVLEALAYAENRHPR